MYLLPITLHVTLLGVGEAEGDLAGVASELVGGRGAAILFAQGAIALRATRRYRSHLRSRGSEGAQTGGLDL